MVFITARMNAAASGASSENNLTWTSGYLRRLRRLRHRVKDIDITIRRPVRQRARKGVA